MNAVNRKNYQWFLIAFAWILAMLLGYVGFSRHAAITGLANSWVDNLYLTLQLIPMNSGAVPPPVPWELVLARFLIPVLTALAAIKALLALFSERIRLLQLSFGSDHIIICGLSRKGYALAQRFRQQGRKVAVIERNENNEWLESCRRQGMVVLIGNAADRNLLLTAGIQTAGAIFAVTESNGTNAEISVLARELVIDRKQSSLVCFVHLADPHLCRLLKEYDGCLGKSSFRLEFFNIFEEGARMVLQKFPAWENSASDDTPPPHLLVIGMGHMGEVLVVTAARDWWNQQTDKSKRMVISVVDRNAQEKIYSLQFRFPQIVQACDLISLEVDVLSSDFERADFLAAPPGKPPVSRVYILVDDDKLSLYTAMTLRQRLIDTKIPVVIRVAEEDGLAMLLEDRRNYVHSYQNLHVFALINNTCTADLLHRTVRDQLARAVHEDYIIHQSRSGADVRHSPALRAWDELEPHYKTANYEYVDSIQALLSNMGYQIVPLTDWDAPSIKFLPEEIEQMAEKEHARWCAGMLAKGWRYAPGPRDLKAKTNPDLVDWRELPETEKEKNRAQVRSIPAFLSRAGFQLQHKTETQPTVRG